MRLFLRGAAERWVAEGQSGGGGTPMASPSDDGRGEATVSCDAAGCSGAVHGMRAPPWRRVAVGASQGAQEQCVACVHHPGGVWQWAPRRVLRSNAWHACTTLAACGSGRLVDLSWMSAAGALCTAAMSTCDARPHRRRARLPPRPHPFPTPPRPAPTHSPISGDAHVCDCGRKRSVPW